LSRDQRHTQDSHINQAKASLQQAISWYGNFRRHGSHPPAPELQAAVRPQLQSLKSALEKLDQKVIRIATFGLVSRGKSTVVNGLLGQKVLETGAVHGITRWPKAVRWTPPGEKIQIELIDTPGLDEIAGEERAQMAKEVVRQSDLILFIVAGDITRTEYEALCELRESHKPLILVFNKIDLYPETDQQAIYQQLQTLGEEMPLVSANEIVLVAAEPSPMQVRVEWQDGTVTHEWESPPPQVDALKQKILDILNQEGKSLLALNALFQAREAENQIAVETLRHRDAQAEEIIWKYTKYKALAVAINPVALFDIVGGTVADLALIRALARLYGLPMTSYEAGRLWRKILVSAGTTLISEIGSSLLLGFGKSGVAVTTVMENPGALATYAGVALTQGGVAGYGAYAVGKAAQVYLQEGCSWGSLGASTVIQDILQQVEPNTIIYRLRQELEQQLAGNSKQ
jgi:small GTP-binding protein